MYKETISDFPNYSITKDGRVWSFITNKWLKPGRNHSGYLSVVLCKDKKYYSREIHRLVLETYIGPRPDNMECRHLDGNKQHNALSNLKWGTRKENIQDSIKHGTHKFPGLKGEKCGRSKLVEKDVRMIIYMWRTKLFKQKEIAKIYNIDQAHVSRIINKGTWRHIWAA